MARYKLDAGQVALIQVLHKCKVTSREIGRRVGVSNHAVNYHLAGRAKTTPALPASDIAKLLRAEADRIEAAIQPAAQ